MHSDHIFQPVLEKITQLEHRAKTEEVITWVETNYRSLAKRVAWQQPLFTHHGTFILGLKPSKKHLTINPEVAGIDHFGPKIDAAGYSRQTMTFSIPWDQEVDYELLKEIIDWQLSEKARITTFWR